MTNLGGKREGAGRKPLAPSQRKQRKTIWLTPDEQTFLLELGDNVQDGIRQLIIGAMNAKRIPPCKS